MKKGWLVLGIVVGVALVVVGMVGGAYNGLVSAEEGVRSAWSQVENVYQRRLDLIPNLVETVKGYAAHEQSTFVEVTEARAKASGSLSAAAFGDPAQFEHMQATQDALSAALGRLMVVVERYPDLKANENFLSLQSQLEGTENRIAVERGRFNEASRNFNVRIRTFPTNLIGALFGFKEKSYFQAAPQAAQAPVVDF